MTAFQVACFWNQLYTDAVHHVPSMKQANFAINLRIVMNLKYNVGSDFKLWDLDLSILEYFAGLFFGSTLKSFISSANGIGQDHFKCVQFNKWEKRSRNRFEKDDNGININITFNIINIKESPEDSPDPLQNYQLEDSSERLWYHGTDTNAVENIIDGGLNLGKGEPRQDFSHKDGFYLSPAFRDAEQWAKRQAIDSKPAVIVFNIKKDLQEFPILDLRERKPDAWQAIVNHFRNGAKQKSHPVSGDLCRDLRRCQCIIGVRNGDKRQIFKDQGGRIQLCIRGIELLNEFNTNIESVIVYDV